jgi:hypothetical protein
MPAGNDFHARDGTLRPVKEAASVALVERMEKLGGVFRAISRSW